VEQGGSLTIEAGSLAAGTVAAGAAGLPVAYENESGLNGNQNFSGSLGMEFTVNTAVTVYDLGAFDDGQATMAASITVGIYNVSTEALIGQLETISGTAGNQMGSDRFVTLARPLR
jgi:hypothetical protein